MTLFSLKNDRGYAFLMVLLIIVIIGIIAPPIMSSILSSSSQYKITEETMQHNQLVEMGVSYFEQTVLNILEGWELPNEWVPPPNWEALSEEERERYFDTMIVQYTETELGKRNFQPDPPLFHSDGSQFTLSYRIIKNLDQVFFEIDIHTKVNSGETVITTQEIPMPEINVSIESGS